MPAGKERALRRRIRSVESTQKITRAMELIAASRIVRAQQAINAASPYTEDMRHVVEELAGTPEARGHWVFAGTGDRPMVIVVGADRGLAGAFSVSVMRGAEELLRRLSERGRRPVLVGAGRKVSAYFRFRGVNLDAYFGGFADRPHFENAREIVAAVSELIAQNGVGEIHLVSTRFLSLGSQRPVARRLVPIEPGEPSRGDQDRKAGTAPAAFEFEPGPGEIMDTLLPRWLEAEIYMALLQSAASFHVAQQRAMKAATDNADKLIKTLRRDMNRARQDSITTEIMEIVGGAEALRASDAAGAASGRADVYVTPEAS
ncbi:MAG TPA: ATP synthase F1 subunit gamma [Acidimicrobiales bacterium]|nr:ATP synthase F1 subunit gamma [Acidimicrobiales bacterium]